MGDADSGNSNTQDIWAARTDSNLNVPPIGIQQIGNEIPLDFRLFQNFPNPFNSSTIIRFDINKQGNVKLSIYDILGREVYSINEFRKAGSCEMIFNGENLASGLYYYRIELEGFVETKKMVLIK